MRWRSEFARAIPGDISLALAIRSQHLPKALFRYRSMTDLTLDNLRHGVEYLSAPDAFNDPFDSAAAVALEIHTESLLDHGADKLMQYLVEHHGVQWTDLDHIDVHRATHPFRRVVNMVLDRDPSFTGSKANFSQVLVSATEKVVGTTLSDHARSLVRNSFRIVCFSETYQSILMWSHYADQHRGFCIEYDFTADPWRSVVFPVAYQRSMPDVTESFSP